MKPFVALLVFINLGQVFGNNEMMQSFGLRWCNNFCLCPQNSETAVRCLQSDEIFDMLNFSTLQREGLARRHWDPSTHLQWCRSGQCFCHQSSNKHFACMDNQDLLVNIINEAGADLSNDQVEDVSTSEGELDSEHDKRDMDEERRNRRRNRKNRRNRKRNRNDRPEYPSSYEDTDYISNSVERDNSEYQDVNLLPKQEAINSSPMLTAMQPSTIREPFTPPTQPAPVSGNSSDESPQQPRVQEITRADFNRFPSEADDSSPVYEVPLHRKTVATKVSEDLQQITEDVQHIRSDVIFNQRILLVTVGIAGVAMLG